MRGRRPQPVEVKRANGNVGHRKLNDPPKVVHLLPTRPKDLSAAERRYWDKYAPRALSMRTISTYDGDAMLRLCQLSVMRDEVAKEIRSPKAKDKPRQRRFLLQLSKEIRACEDTFGFNALARARLTGSNTAPREESTEPVDDLDA